MGRVLVTSRSAAEYRAMFDLSPGGSVLDCCAGGSSFCAETSDVIAVDPAYAMGYASLSRLVRVGLADGDRIIAANVERFEWSWHGDIAACAAIRTTAAELFLADLRARPSRYVAAALPCLPFASDSFDVTLCSHLLFTWANQLDEPWYLRALRELVRVARFEVRVFPLVLQGSGAAVPFLDRLRASLPPSELRDVPYRFQRGAHQMLVIDASSVSP